MWTQRLLVVFLIIAASVLTPPREALAQSQRFTPPRDESDGFRCRVLNEKFSDCHEGNYTLANILSAARAEEKKK